MRLLLLAVVAVLGLALGSCTDEQITRAQAIVAETDLKLAQANSAVAAAEQALATAKDLADKLGSEQAQRVVGQASSALDQVKQAQSVIATTDKAVHSALDAATEAQAAGGSTIGVLTASAKGAIPGLLAALYATLQWLKTAKSLRQTVLGLDDAREQLAPEHWDQKVAPALSAAQDVATKKQVALIQAKAA